MNIKPLFNNVVLKQINKPKPQQSAIILPNQDEDDVTVLAEVVAVGTGGFYEGAKLEMQLKIGDKVLFNNYSSSPFVLNDETFILINQTDVLAVVI